MRPRPVSIETTRPNNILPYDKFLGVEPSPIPEGAKVAVIGAGGIGFDVAEKLVHSHIDFYELYGMKCSLSCVRLFVCSKTNKIPNRF